METTGTPENGGVQSRVPGEPVADHVSYDTGYGYGPGYRGPGDSGYGDGYGTAAPPGGPDTTASPGQQAAAVTLGGAPVGPSRLPPVVGPTPALRGLPGGPGIEPVGADSQAPAPAGHPRQQTSGSIWQRAQSRWSDCGIVWQRPVADWEPAEAEWDRIQSAWAPPRKKRRGLRPRSRRPGAANPGVPGRGAGRKARRGIGAAAIVAGVVVVFIAAVIAAVYLVGRGGEKAAAHQGRPAALRVSPYPPAALAAADFMPSPSLATRGVFQSLSAVASYGTTVVAAGSQTGTDIGRSQFFVCTDSGRTWRLAPVAAADGGEAATAYRPATITAGPAGWLAVGPGVSWTSRTGRSWQLSPAQGIPLNPGDRVLTVTATARGFLAGGSSTAHGISAPVVWTSPDGLSWHRAVTRLRLPAAGVVGAVVSAAAHGDSTVIAARVTTTVLTGKGNQTGVLHRTATGLWQSPDGGVTWIPVSVPVSNGAVNAVSGLASSGTGFVMVRTANTSASGLQAVIYSSTTGRTWRYAGTITAAKKAHLRLLAVAGSDQGAAIAATVTGGNFVAYRSATGRSWHQTAVLGNLSATSLSGLTVLPGGNVVAAGADTVPAGSQAFLSVAGSSRVVVDLARIHGAAFTQRAVTAIAATPALKVALGSADAQPAVWEAPPGGPWSRATGAARAVFGRPGQAALTSVTGGSSGWLAVGGGAGGVQHPVVVFSPDGKTWRATDGAAAFAQAGAITSAAASRGSQYVVVGTRHMLAVTAGPFGFVAIGRRGGAPAAWTSPDGRAWNLIDLPPVSGGTAYLRYVTALGKTVVAAGSVVRATGSIPLVAVSRDGGLTWRETTVSVPGNPAGLTGVTATGSGFVAVGVTGAPGRLDVFVLTSADGTAWKTFVPSGTGLSGPGAQEITALTTAGGKLLGAGFTATAKAEVPTLWVAPPTPAITRGTAASSMPDKGKAAAPARRP